MVCLKDLKRSLALTLCSVLVLSGIDTTAFADEGKPRIGYDLSIATTFYDYSHLMASYGRSDGFGLEFIEDVTVPMDFSECDNVSSYGKDNISSIKVKSLTDNIEVSYDMSNLKSYIPFGYYSLKNFDDTLVDLYEKYLEIKGVDTSSRDDVKVLAEEFYSTSKDYKLYITYSNGVVIDTSIDLVPYEYIHIGHTSATDIVKVICYNTDNNIKNPSYSNGVTADGYVLSVPTSKTVKNDDFYLDNNAISAISKDSHYDTYYVDIDSSDNLEIPLDDLSRGSSITKAKIGDTVVYDNSRSLQLNGGVNISKDLSNDTSWYRLVDNSSLISSISFCKYGGSDSSMLLDILKNQFKVEKLSYNNNQVDLSSLQDKSFSDIYNNGKMLYAKTNTGLLGSEEYKNGYNINYKLPYTGSTDDYYFANIKLKSPLTVNNISSDNYKKRDEINYYYSTTDSREAKFNFYNDMYPVKYFYSLDDTDIDGYNKSVSDYRNIIYSSLGDTTTIPLFIKVPNTSDTKDFLSSLYNSNYRDNVYFLGRYGFNRSIYEDLSSDDFILKDGYYYFSYNSSIDGIEDGLVSLLNRSYNTSFENIEDVKNSDYSVNGYKFKIGINDYDFSNYKKRSIFGGYSNSYPVSNYIEDSNYIYIYTPDFCIDKFILSDSSTSDLKTYFEQYCDTIYKFTANGKSDAKFLSELGITPDNFCSTNISNSYYLYNSDTDYLYGFDDLNGEETTNIILKLSNNYAYNQDILLDAIDDVVDFINDCGGEIDYEKSSMPDFSSTADLDEFIDITEYNEPTIEINNFNDLDSSSGHPNKKTTLGTSGIKSDSITSDTYVDTDSVCNGDSLTIDNNIFNPLKGVSTFSLRNRASSPFNKGEELPLTMQVVVYEITDTIKNANVANYVHIASHSNLTDTSVFDNDSSVLELEKPWHSWEDNGLCTYADYKFGNIIFASKPSAPLDLTLDGDKLTWVKPIDEGLGYTANTRSSKMSIRSVNPSFTSKTDDVIHLDSYKLDIKDSLDNVVYTQTLTDNGSGLKEEITIPATYLSSDYTAYVYATNKIGVSDSATINLEAPNGSVEVVTERDSYKVGDTITYTETITNSGSVDLNNVKVTQSLTGGTYEAQAGVSLTDNVATITSLPVGSSMELKYKYVVPNSVNTGDTISNRVSITSDEGISKDVTKNVTIVELNGSVGVVTERDSYKVGETITYTETITNNGTIDLTNVKVTQSLTGGTYNAVTGVTTTDNVATIPALNQGDSVTLTYKYVIPEGVNVGDIISNTVSITSDEGLNTSVTKTVTVVDSIKDLDLDVTTDKSSYKPGDTVILKSSVKNTGEVDLTNVKITQQLDGEYIPKSGVTMSGKDASIPTLAVGETVEVEYKIVIPSNYNQTSISNKTDVTADDGVSKNVVKTITVVLPTPTKAPAPAPVVTKAPTPVPTKAPTAEPTTTKAPTEEPTKAPIPTKAPTAEPTKAPTPVPEYDFTIKDVYHNDDGTTEVKERENVRIKEGEHYSFSALDSDDYIPRVPKYEGIATKDTEIIFDYDEKEKRVTLQGYVTYSDGSPIKDKLIEISGKENKSGITDSTGFYRIENILVGDYNYTLYNDVTTGSGILAKCDIKVIKKNGIVEVKYTDDDCKVDYVTEDGVIRVNANIKKEEVATPSPTPTAEPTLAPTKEPTVAPTQEPTVAPTIEPAVEPTVKPTKKPTPVSTKKPTSTPKPTKKPVVAPIKVSTPEPTRKPTRVVYLAQTGIYDIKKVVSAGVLIISGLGLVIIALRRRKK